MELRLLGPVRAELGGRAVNLGARMQRFVLAVLALEANRLVTTERLIDLTWPMDPPRTARRIIHSQVSRLRATLSAAPAGNGDTVAIRGDGPGYVLDCRSDRIDVHRFTGLLSRAQHTGDDHTRVKLLDEALALWRGPFLAGTASEATRTLLGGHFEEARLAAAEDRLAALLRQGNHPLVIDEASRLAAEHPDRPRLIGHLMLALHRAGRTVESLTAYQQAKRRFADEFGLDPPAELRQLETAILRADADPAPIGEPPFAGVQCRPAQLPTDVPGFTGRAGQLADLDALVTGRSGRAPTAVVISAVSGTAGVGKTALAVHWAHTVAKEFPDGQLYVNLRGFDPAGRVMAPTEAVRGFLDALGVPPERIPATLDAQTALYRSLLAGKHVLVLLDNARDAEQARPLLPGTPTALALVTSRNQLTPLLAVDGAHPLPLDTLSGDEALGLLTQRLGARRIIAEPDAVQQIITACAGLPLALSIAAARAQQTTFPLAILAIELGQAAQRLDALDGGDLTTDLRSVFSWSYSALSAPVTRLFRLLGLHPGPDISTAAAASLAGHPAPQTRRLLTDLTRASLLVEHVPGRYTFHDLLRAYATELVHTTDPDHIRRATGRVLDHYTHAAHAANRLIYPARDPIPLPLTPVSPGVSPEHLADHQQAMAWLTAEHPVLLAAIRHAADTGFDTRTWQLAWALDTFLHRSGNWDDHVATWQIALHAARRLDDVTAQATAHRRLASTDTQLGRHTDANTHLEHALGLFIRTGDPVGQAHTHRNLAYLRQRQGDPQRALGHAQQALTLLRSTGDRCGQASALNEVGWCHAQLGDHTRAIAHCEQALPLFQQVADHHGQAMTWDSLGYAHHHLGHHIQAIDCYQQALTLLRDLGDRYNEADVLAHLGDTHRAGGDPTAARDAWTHALTILTDLDHPHAKAVRAKLDTLRPHRAPPTRSR